MPLSTHRKASANAPEIYSFYAIYPLSQRAKYSEFVLQTSCVKHVMEKVQGLCATT